MIEEWIRHSAGRIGDMYPNRALQVQQHADGDVVVSIIEADCDLPLGFGEPERVATVEFCSLSGGGGRSPRVHAALLVLMKAIAEDNKENPEIAGGFQK